MACCNSTIQSFFNVATTTVVYSPTMQQQYGPAPKVTVLYWDGEKYYSSGIFTSISLVGYPVSQIVIDHGSDSATGLVKIG